MTLRIDNEFRSLIPPLSADERAGLEAELLRDGCRDALLAWKCDDDSEVLIDGHNRYEICTANNISYRTEQVNGIADRSDAMVWIINHQFSRRNLNTFQRAELALKLEPLIAAKAKENQRMAGGDKALPPKLAEARIETREEVAKAAGVGHTTIDKVKTIIRKASPETIEQVRANEVSIDKAYQAVKPKAATKTTKPKPAKTTKLQQLFTELEQLINQNPERVSLMAVRKLVRDMKPYIVA